MYNEDLNKANKANKGFACKALPVVRYILFALIATGVILLAFAWYRDTHSACLLYTSPSPRDGLLSRMPSSA